MLSVQVLVGLDSRKFLVLLSSTYRKGDTWPCLTISISFFDVNCCCFWYVVKRTGPVFSWISSLILYCWSAMIMSLYGEDSLCGDTDTWGVNQICDQLRACKTESCKGNSTVFRVSFLLFMFHIIHAAFLLVCGCLLVLMWFSACRFQEQEQFIIPGLW